MLLFLLSSYFALMVMLAAIFVLPAVRIRVWQATTRIFDFVTVGVRRVLRASGAGLGAAGGGMQSSAAGLIGYIHRYKHFWVGGLLAVTVPVAIGVLLGQYNLVFYEDALRSPDRKVAALLHGEHLVPPLPLPPEVFETAEVERVAPLVREASRNWDLLDPDFRARLLMVYKIMREQHGYEMALIEGYRSPERQAKLAAIGDHVTRAGAFQSYHQFGLATDNAFYRNGKIVISEKDPWAMEGYRLYGEVAESMGLTWGGRWSFRDYGHVEYRKPGFKLPKP